VNSKGLAAAPANGAVLVRVEVTDQRSANDDELPWMQRRIQAVVELASFQGFGGSKYAANPCWAIT